MKLTNKFSKYALGGLTAISLSGCLSTEQAGLLTGTGAYTVAKETGASSEVAAFLGVAGLIFGQQLGNPCKTNQSGVVREVEDSRYGTRRTQTQQTAYNCTTVGAPAGASAPAFN